MTKPKKEPMPTRSVYPNDLEHSRPYSWDAAMLNDMEPDAAQSFLEFIALLYFGAIENFVVKLPNNNLRKMLREVQAEGKSTTWIMETEIDVDYDIYLPILEAEAKYRKAIDAKERKAQEGL